MKQRFLIATSFVTLFTIAIGSCSKQKTSTPKPQQVEEIASYIDPLKCPPGQHREFYYDFDGFNFHRPVNSCHRGFWFCFIAGKWHTRCVPNNETSIAIVNPDGTVEVWAQVVSGQQLEVHFPIALASDPDFTAEDLANFSVDDERDINEGENNPLIMQIGEYRTTYTATEIVVTVPIKP